MPHTRIIAATRHLPEKVVTNRDLVESHGFPFPLEWFERSTTGIRERRFAGPEETTLTLGAAAIRQLLQKTSVAPDSIDVVIMTSSTCEVSGGALNLAHMAGLKPGVAFDIAIACTGFVLALDLANQYLRGGAARRVLIVSSEVQSRHVYLGADGQHHKFAAILGDGAGAVLLERSEEPGVEGTGRATMPEQCRSVFRSNYEPMPEFPHIPPGKILYANERGIVSAFLRLPIEVCHRALAEAGVGIQDVRWLISHQPQMDMLEVIRKELGFSPEQHPVNADRYGNTSSASIPICLAELMEEGRLQRGDRMLMLGMGAGFTAMAHVLRF
ncbi:ketoacyl-ACP synthase III [Archangium violaceum]|uniref:3-oxoacyl-ACP synthase III family protein n=1 Tax=Archangium violaceum TaxID=83451 RepID=UPI0019512AA5|nr:ketoacyl-ACP synthase III [Archangium violaceum]QRN93591.1 ketoacyl-ACP synthase III [Archangium violaceum]